MGAILSRGVDGSYGMDHPACGEVTSGRSDRLPRRETFGMLSPADAFALLEDGRPALAVDSAVDAAPTHQRRVRGIDHRVHLDGRDVSLDELHVRHGPTLGHAGRGYDSDSRFESRKEAALAIVRWIGFSFGLILFLGTLSSLVRTLVVPRGTHLEARGSSSTTCSPVISSCGWRAGSRTMRLRIGSRRSPAPCPC